MSQSSAIAALGYSTTKPITAPKPGTESSSVFGAFASEFEAGLRQSEQTAMAAMSGTADPHALVQALAQTELAVEATTAIRDKVVEAYQEILRMPV